MFRVLPFNIKSNVERGRDFLGNIVESLVDQPLHFVSRGEGNLALVNLPNVTTKSQVQNFRLDFTTKEGVKGTINWQDESKMTLTFPGGGELICYL